jgi:nitrogen regulatory protein P-II 1
MKKIEAILDPSEVEVTQRSLSVMGVRIMTVTEVKGFGGQGQTQVYRGMRFEPPYLTEAKVEIVVPDEMMESAVALIRETAKQDPSGQSRIVVFPMEDIVGKRVSRSVAA